MEGPGLQPGRIDARRGWLRPRIGPLGYRDMGDPTQGSRARIASAPRRWRSRRDGRHLAVSLGFAARMIDVATGKEVRRFAEAAGGNECRGREPRRCDARDDRTDDQALGHRHGTGEDAQAVGPRRFRRVGRVQSRRNDAWRRPVPTTPSSSGTSRRAASE